MTAFDVTDIRADVRSRKDLGEEEKIANSGVRTHTELPNNPATLTLAT